MPEEGHLKRTVTSLRRQPPASASGHLIISRAKASYDFDDDTSKETMQKLRQNAQSTRVKKGADPSIIFSFLACATEWGLQEYNVCCGEKIDRPSVLPMYCIDAFWPVSTATKTQYTS